MTINSSLHNLHYD